MEKNTQQPVAWIDDDGMVFWKDGIPHDGTDLYSAPPVPRAVLMAFGEEVLAEASKSQAITGFCMNINISAIADRYASQVKPEPVNQQMLAALEQCYTQLRKLKVKDDDVCDALNASAIAIAAAEASQPVAVAECPFPCGWQQLHKLAVEDGAYLARAIEEDEPVTGYARATTMRVVGNLIEVTRAMLSASQKQEGGE